MNSWRDNSHPTSKPSSKYTGLHIIYGHSSLIANPNPYDRREPATIPDFPEKSFRNPTLTAVTQGCHSKHPYNIRLKAAKSTINLV